MATTSAPIMHKAPLMFCAPGCPQDPETSFGGYGDTIDSIVPWPGGLQITIATISNDAVPNWVLDIIKSVVNEWIKGMCCVRARLYDESKPTMNFNFGGWKDNRVVYCHAYIKRLAAHLFGHPLGLPHAQVNQPLWYNKPELEKFYGAYYAAMIQSAKGCPQLQDSYSIVHHDLLSALSSSGADVLQGGCAIDNEARALLQSLYPTWPKPSCSCRSATTISSFNESRYGTICLPTPMTYNIVAGLRRLDMGTNGNCRLRSKITDIKNKKEYTWEVGTWADTNHFDASYSILSFEEED